MPIGSAVAGGWMERLASESANGSTVASAGATEDSAQQDGDRASGSANGATVSSKSVAANSAQLDALHAEAQRKAKEAAAETAQFFGKNIDLWNRSSLHSGRPGTKATDEPQQAATSHDAPRQGATAPPARVPSGLQSIWDFIDEEPSACGATCGEEAEEADEDEKDYAETQRGAAKWDWFLVRKRQRTLSAHAAQ